MTNKNEEQFQNKDLMNAMFATKEDQAAENMVVKTKPATKKDNADKSKVATKKEDDEISITRIKQVNRSTKKTKKPVETRSQRRQLLLTEHLNNDMRLLAIVKGISVNEMIIEVMTRYVKREMKDKDVKSMMDKLAKMRG